MIGSTGAAKRCIVTGVSEIVTTLPTMNSDACQLSVDGRTRAKHSRFVTRPVTRHDEPWARSDDFASSNAHYGRCRSTMDRRLSSPPAPTCLRAHDRLRLVAASLHDLQMTLRIARRSSSRSNVRSRRTVAR